MTPPATRRLKSVALAVLVAVLIAACTGSGGSTKSFCERLPKTENVLDILADFGSTTPAQLADRFEAGLADYRDLERSAPRSIRADVARVADTVELILDVVKRNPDDMAAIRRELGGKAAQLASAGKSGQAVARFSRDECGLTLDSTSPASIIPPVSAETTTTG